MTALSGDRVHGDLVEAADIPAPLVERPASPVWKLPVAPALYSRGRRLARRFATVVVPNLSHRVQYVGRVGVIGVALLVFSVVCFLSANSPLRHQLAGQQSDLAKTQQDQLARHRTGADLTPTAQLQTFVSKLPARAELPAITEQVVAQASAAGLALERGSYDFTVTHSGKIVRARLSFPLQGTYPNIRQFVNRTLAAIPGAAVDGLRLERKTIGSSEISAEVSFAVFLRNDQ
jgi:Tfp pilus assembly protein PilO